MGREEGKLRKKVMMEDGEGMRDVRVEREGSS